MIKVDLAKGVFLLGFSNGTDREVAEDFVEKYVSEEFGLENCIVLDCGSPLKVSREQVVGVMEMVVKAIRPFAKDIIKKKFS